MHQYFLIFIFCFATSIISAQTKLIAHKSHGGSIESFRLAYENNSEDLFNSNFGQAPQQTIRSAALDSLIFVSDSIAVMVTSKFCQKTYSNEVKLWKAGRDTVRNHPLFSKKHSLDSIKIILQERYHFKNPVEKIQFIGYDNKIDSSKCNDIRYVALPPTHANEQKPTDSTSYIMMGIVAFSLLSGGLSWMISKNRV